MKILISNVAKETGTLLTKYLDEFGIVNNGKGPTLCYGVGSNSNPNLNGNCGIDKIERLRIMTKAGVSTVPWFDGTDVPAGMRFPLLARNSMGYGGDDIVPVFQPEEVGWRKRAGWDWFSEVIPIERELRVWVFRGLHLDTYEKKMMRPYDFKFIGRNFRNGFDFVPIAYEHRTATIEATKAITALRLDFGAVDLIIGKDNKIYILEVNTAPGVIKSGAQYTLRRLALEISRWEASLYA